MGYLNRFLPVLFLFWTSVLAMLPASYDVIWDKPGVNGSADSMPLGGGDIGLNTWYENGKSAVSPSTTCLSTQFVILVVAKDLLITDTSCNRHYSHVHRQERNL